MLTRQTVFVVGAGASFEFDLPVGSVLAQRISDKLDLKFDNFPSRIASGDEALYRSMDVAYPGRSQELFATARLIRDGILLSHSIDDFLHIHSANELAVAYGKAAIVKCILEAEMGSSLRLSKPDPDTLQQTINFRGSTNTWLTKLIRILARGMDRSERARIFEKCAFVIFNYDRCIEHFFEHALQPLFEIDRDEARKIIAGLKIIHPYGTPKMRPFGSVVPNVISGEGIKTYTETVDLPEIKNLISAAERVVFLGFGYHRQNLELLASAGSLPTQKLFLGTGLNMSPPDLEWVGDTIRRWGQNLHFEYAGPNQDKGSIRLYNNLSCSQLIDFYSKTL